MREASSNRQSSSGQALVEMALTLPIFLMVALTMVDAARYVYIRTVLQRSAETAARAMTVDRGTDCGAWSAGTDSGGGVVNVGVDPDSKYSPTQTSTPPFYGPAPAGVAPPPGKGYLYLYPSAASSSTNCDGCSATACTFVEDKSETAYVTYTYAALTPFASGLQVVMQMRATEPVP